MVALHWLNCCQAKRRSLFLLLVAVEWCYFLRGCTVRLFLLGSAPVSSGMCVRAPRCGFPSPFSWGCPLFSQKLSFLTTEYFKHFYEVNKAAVTWVVMVLSIHTMAHALDGLKQSSALHAHYMLLPTACPGAAAACLCAHDSGLSPGSRWSSL